MAELFVNRERLVVLPGSDPERIIGIDRSKGSTVTINKIHGYKNRCNYLHYDPENIISRAVVAHETTQESCVREVDTSARFRRGRTKKVFTNP